MPWTVDSPPAVAKTWPESEQMACVIAANGVLEDGGTDSQAIQACINASGRSRQLSWVELVREVDEFQEPGRKITITDEDLRTAVENFGKSKNGFIPIEMGDHGAPQIAGRVLEMETRQDGDVTSLWGLAYFNDIAESEIDAGNLESISIEAVPSAPDRETGEDQGFTMLAVALLPPGREFVEGMQPVALSKDGGDILRRICRLAKDNESASVGNSAPAKRTSADDKTKGQHKMKLSEAIEALKNDQTSDEDRQAAIEVIEQQAGGDEEQAAKLSKLQEERDELQAKLEESQAKIDDLSKSEGEASVQLSKTNETVVQLSKEVDKLRAQAAERDADAFLREHEDRIYPAERENLKTLLLSKESSDTVRDMIANRPVIKLSTKPGDLEDRPDDNAEAIIKLAKKYQDEGLGYEAAFDRATREIKGS